MTTTTTIPAISRPFAAPKNGTPTPVTEGNPQRKHTRVTWKQVATVFILVGGACVLAIFGHETIAAGLAGAAGGFSVNRPKEQP